MFSRRTEKTVLTQAQTDVLERALNTNPYVNFQRRETLARENGLTVPQVKIWFQTRRIKEKTIRDKGGLYDFLYNPYVGKSDQEHEELLGNHLGPVDKSASKDATIEKLQQENRELKEELRQLKGSGALENNMVLLAKEVLNLKVSTEKKFKKLGKKVKHVCEIRKLNERVAKLEEKIEQFEDEQSKLEQCLCLLKQKLHEAIQQQQCKDEQSKLEPTTKDEQLEDLRYIEQCATPEVLAECLEKRLRDGFQSRLRIRVVLRQAQIDELVRAFNTCKYQSAIDRKALAEQTGLTPEQVKIWFMHRRYHTKRAESAARMEKTEEENNEQSEDEQSSITEQSTKNEQSDESGGAPRIQQKQRPERLVLTVAQSDELKRAFNISQYQSAGDRERLARSVGLSFQQVKGWFQNQRSKSYMERVANN